MKTQKTWIMLLVPALAAFMGLSTAEERSHRHRPVVEIADARIKFEINSTDEDGGFQVFLDADPWQKITNYDPRGRLVFRAKARGSIGANGGTEMFLESGEPEFSELSLEDLLRRFRAGTYYFRGVGIEGERLVGEAQLTHDLPSGPVLVFPPDEGEPLDPERYARMGTGRSAQRQPNHRVSGAGGSARHRTGGTPQGDP